MHSHRFKYRTALLYRLTVFCPRCLRSTVQVYAMYMHVGQLSFSTCERNVIFRMSKTFDTSGISSAIDRAARRTAYHNRLERCYSLSRTTLIDVYTCNYVRNIATPSSTHPFTLGFTSIHPSHMKLLSSNSTVFTC